ncbi:MAG: LemA family protein [Bdellovibrionota bacterium]
MRQILRSLILFLSVVSLSACGYNTLQSQDEQIKASWAEVLNQYQRRADLVPNLVQVVKGYAEHEKKIFDDVSEARSKLGTINPSPALLENPAQFEQFNNAQKGFGTAVHQLLAIAENYPNLKADGAFRDLQAQLEGTENRIAVARNRYIQAVQEFNTTVRSFPSNFTAKWLSMTPKPTLTVENESAVSKPPTIDFGK